MNKTAIKNFAVWARNKLIADITYKAGLIGVSEKGIAQPLPQSTRDLQFFDIGTKDYAQVAGTDIEQRNALVRAIQEKENTSDYHTAFKAIIEEVAYTWFNRLIAIRFMEVNDYLPSRVRVLSSENTAKNEPDFVTTPFDTDMVFTMAEQDRIIQLKDENKLDELFRMLFIKQCNKLHEILPELFEETNNYTELLLSISFTDSDGVVYHLVHDIPEDDFNIEKEGQVEIIGWMYQYYNIEPKDETFALLKKNVKITKERIPAATQLFTPDWIVRYMVENSLGRLWVEGHPSDSLKENWKYYLEEAEQEASVQSQLEQIRAEYRKLNPEDIKVIDPCMGSGHILVYCFDVLIQIYESQGYTQRDAAQSILENNLFGLDIDRRAAQLAYFAVMMKARQYDRRIFTRDIKPHVHAIEESNGINRGQLKYFGADLSPIERNKAKLQINGLLDTMVDAKEYGSILDIDKYDWNLLFSFVQSMDNSGQMSFDTVGIDHTQRQLNYIVKLGLIMSQKYHAVITNPPYMGSVGMSAKLTKFVIDNYPDSKADMFAIFIERCEQMTRNNYFQAMITQHAWMFLSSFERLRTKLLNTDTINMAHLGARAFDEIGGEVVQTTSFVLRKSHLKGYKGTYRRLIEPTSEKGKELMFLSTANTHIAIADDFLFVPGQPIAYWVSEQIFKVFSSHKLLGDIVPTKKGLDTGENDKFLRFWHEVNFEKVGIGYSSSNAFSSAGMKWAPHDKGGEFRRWYGNKDWVINWENNGYELHHSKANLRSEKLYFSDAITWSSLSSGKISFRNSNYGAISNTAGSSLYPSNEEDAKYLIALLNSTAAQKMLDIISPTLNYSAGPVGQIPIIFSNNYSTQVRMLADENITLCKNDWDSFETSWDFLAHPLVLSAYVSAINGGHKSTLAQSYAKWRNICEERFSKLKTNEEKLNRIFVDIYGLQRELTAEVDDKDVTVRIADLTRDVRSLLSYAVGCMFGRYSLDEPGLVYAGGEWDSGKYSKFIPDKDNCIPNTDEAYFEDDIVGQFVGWMKKAFGEENLEANLDFIANALGNKGTTSREVIRNYFLNDFMKDHIKIYQKRPIYWLFDSGKQNGFKALVYMHRWNADTVGNLRVEYLHKMQHIYEREIIRMQETIDNSRDSREVSKATKRKDKLQKQLKETKDYDAKLAHIALSRIEIDLDDGVKVNYEKVQTGRDGKKMQILAKI